MPDRTADEQVIPMVCSDSNSFGSGGCKGSVEAMVLPRTHRLVSSYQLGHACHSGDPIAKDV